MKRKIFGNAAEKIDTYEESMEIEAPVSVDEQNAAREQIKRILESFIQAIAPGVEAKVSYACGPRTTVYKIDMPENLRGRLIGSQGRNICALRQVLAAMSGAAKFRAIIDLVV
ncbi:KH domain-containing protein [Bdellovibrio bacteriovorus]|uniref:KH domain-containing protein n=1 Tax=Bdellovibrio bacteriovorus TaxID=959 RepID=UPI00130EC696|nr:KH domain-containing protein [Bdellovibrio bacteriovorus]